MLKHFQKAVTVELNRWLDKTVGPLPAPTNLPVSPQGQRKERGRGCVVKTPSPHSGRATTRLGPNSAVEVFCPRHADASPCNHRGTNACFDCVRELTERESRIEKVSALCRRLFVILRLHGLRSIQTQSWFRFATVLIGYDLEDQMEAYLKWKLASVFCWLMDQDEYPDRPSFVPEADRRDVIVGGGVYCFLQAVKGGRTEIPREVVATSLLQFKKACPSVSDSFLEKSMASSGDQLCKPATCPEDQTPDDSLWGHDDCPTPGRCLCHHFTLSALQLEVERTCREVFSKDPFSVYPSFSGPSMRGHFAWGRRRGGALLPVAQMLGHNQKWDPNRRVPIWEEECIQPEAIPQQVELRLSEIEDEFQAELVGIKEPFKVRTISKGPPRAYYVSKYLQKVLWRTIQRHPTFSLVGKPLSAEVLDRSLGTLNPGEVWVSGDYKSATDLLHPRLSESAVASISSQMNLSPGFQKIFRQALTGHTIVTNPGKSDQTKRPQQWGQLMGSPLSFPILCLVNAAVTRRVLELTRSTTPWIKPLSLRKARILVNGDDIGFALDRNQYPLWGYATRKAGLHKSVGKNYISEEFIVLNSETHMYQPDTLPADQEGPLGLSWKYCPWINGALLFGLTPKGGESDTWDTKMPVTIESTLGLGARLRDLLKCAPTSFDLDRLRTIFLREHAEFLALAPSGVDWTIPPELGGLGLDLPGRKWSVRGRRRAAYIAQSEDELLHETAKDAFVRSRNPALLAAAFQAARRRGTLTTHYVTRGQEIGQPPLGGYLFNLVHDFAHVGKRDVDLDELLDERSEERLRQQWKNGVERQIRLSHEWQPDENATAFDETITEFLEFPRVVTLTLDDDALPPIIHLRDDTTDLICPLD